MRFRCMHFIVFTATSAMLVPSANGQDLTLTLRHQPENADGSHQFQVREQTETWKPNETAFIVCDVWDLHHCQDAVRRLEQFAPRLLFFRSNSSNVRGIFSSEMSDFVSDLAHRQSRKPYKTRQFLISVACQRSVFDLRQIAL